MNVRINQNVPFFQADSNSANPGVVENSGLEAKVNDVHHNRSGFSIVKKIFTIGLMLGSLVIGACKKAVPTPFSMKIVNNTAGITGTYPAYEGEETRVKLSDLGAGIDQKRLAVYTLTNDGNGLDRLIAFTNINQELVFIANNGTSYALMTYTPVTTSKGNLYDLIDAQPGQALITRDVKVYRSDDSVYPPTSFPDNSDGIIQEFVSELDNGLHPGGFSLGSIGWTSGNLKTGYTSYKADGINVPGQAYINWTRIVLQYGSGANGLRVAKMTFKSEMLGGISNVGDIAGDTGRFVEDQTTLNSLTSYIFSRN